MSPPSTQSVPSSAEKNRYFSPERTTVVSPESAEELIAQFQSEFISPVSKMSFDLNQVIDKLSPLFSDGHYQINADFHQTQAPLPDVPLLDDTGLAFKEGARVFVTAQTAKGIPWITGEIKLADASFFYTVPYVSYSDSIPIDRIQGNGDGGAEAGNCCASKDITKNIMDSPAGPFFPEGKWKATALAEILKFFFKAKKASKEKGPFASILEALHRIYFDGKICPEALQDGVCPAADNMIASVKIFAHRRALEEMIAKELYKQFDFSGIRNGSEIVWPNFDLSHLPTPEGLKLTGTVDLTWYYNAKTKETVIGLRNLKAKVRMPDWWGADATMTLTGNTSIQLQSPGKVTLGFEDFAVAMPTFPAQQLNLATIAAALDGRVVMDVDITQGTYKIQSADLHMHDIDVATHPGHGIQLSKNGPICAPNFQGTFDLYYDPKKTDQAIDANWGFTGSNISQIKDETVAANDITFSGKSIWTLENGHYYPAIDRSHGKFVTDIKRLTPSDTAVSIEQLSFRLDGLRSNKESNEAQFTMHTEAVTVGDLTLKPEAPLVSLHLVGTQKDDSFQLSGNGGLKVLLSNQDVDVAAKIEIDTDKKRSDYIWKLDFVRDQHRFGDIIASKGQLRIRRNHTKKGFLALFQNIQLTTEDDSYHIHVGDKKIAEGVQFHGWLERDKTPFNGLLIVRSLLNRARVNFDFRKQKRSGRFSGNYKIRPFDIAVASNQTLTKTELKGHFNAPTLGELIEKPRAHISDGTASAQLQGQATGPISAKYTAWVRYLPAISALRIGVDSDDPNASTVAFAIAYQNSRGSQDIAEGSANLQGSLHVSKSDGRIKIGGRRPGINHGEVYVTMASEGGPYQRPASPAIYDLLFNFDWLCGIRKGIAYACRRGDGLHFESTIDPNALGLAVKEHDRDIRVRMFADRTPISTSGYWRLMKRYVQKMESSSNGGKK